MIIQRWTRKVLKERKRLYEYLLSLWSKVETQIFKDFEKQNKKNDFEPSLCFTVSDDVKVRIFRNKIKEIMKIYSISLKNYKTSQEIYKESLSNFIWSESSVVSIQPQAPQKPNLRVSFSDLETLTTLIKSSNKPKKSQRPTIKFIK